MSSEVPRGLGLPPKQLGEAGDVDRHVRHHGGRRQSATRRITSNVSSFNRNRDHRIRRSVPYPEPQTPRTRSMARRAAEAEAEAESLAMGEQRVVSIPESAEHEHQHKRNAPSEEWKPSITIGDSLWLPGEDLSRIEIAERRITQCRAWLQYYGATADFPQLLEEAISERNNLDEKDENNTMPVSRLPSTHAEAIAQRLDVLRSAMEDSVFPPERANIGAAIAGYESGAIPVSDSYTLVWGGRIVDRCPDYDTFTRDRTVRLDRYFTQYGEGWLWFEPPLTGDGVGVPSPIVTAKRGTCSENLPAYRKAMANIGHYQTTQGFRRRKEKVTRRWPLFSGISGKRHDSKTTDPDPDGPRMLWKVLLDSGATLPCIFKADLVKLGIDVTRYARQSQVHIATANGKCWNPVYDLDVGLYAGEEKGLALTTSSEAHPPNMRSEPNMMGCTMLPVVVFDGACKTDKYPDSPPERLSGFFPFQHLYISSAPGNFRLWLGEDRHDVVGTAQMPAHMRTKAPEEEDGTYNRKSKADVALPDRPAWLERVLPLLGPPTRTMFEHVIEDGSGQVLREEDNGRRSYFFQAPGGTDLDNIHPDLRIPTGLQVCNVGPKTKLSQRGVGEDEKTLGRKQPKKRLGQRLASKVTIGSRGQ
ncbi:hypothetical protein B0H63DRAFT_459048 [Podospora didyma]|uniref:Uncharacterized protein n=1 Tax=Podospora didyma TaxID=330526 RepID=A0AAE0U7T1_9PEZI|nr:hypothetical protein B0H63DRAFT_459048 [Podospora didyma]